MMDPVIEGLQAMRTTAPPSLLPRVLAATGLADGYVRVPGPLGELFVAFSPDGVSWIAPAGDEAGFEAAFRHHVGRDIVPVPTFPPKWQRALDRALQTGRLGFAPGRPPERVPLPGRGAADDHRHPARRGPPLRLGCPPGRASRGGPRAVGTAMARNPVPVVVPCHRVIRSDGTVGNYAYGPEMKRALLTAEGLDVGRDGGRSRGRSPPHRERHHPHLLLPELPPRPPCHRQAPCLVPRRRRSSRSRLPPLQELPPTGGGCVRKGSTTDGSPPTRCSAAGPFPPSGDGENGRGDGPTCQRFRPPGSYRCELASVFRL